MGITLSFSNQRRVIPSFKKRLIYLISSPSINDHNLKFTMLDLSAVTLTIAGYINYQLSIVMLMLCVKPLHKPEP